MNWKAVRQHNRLASARKAKREAREREYKARIDREGGPIKVGELREATRREEPKSQGLPGYLVVWTVRGRDWIVGYQGGMAYPYRAWRGDGCDIREGIPLTASATKWFIAQFCSEITS